MNHTELLYMYKYMRTLPEKIPPKKLIQMEEKEGIRFINVDSIYITDIEISIGEGSIISPNVYFLGRSGSKVTIGDFTIIQPNTIIVSDMLSTVIGSQCNIGGKIIDCHIQNHVEMEQSTKLTRSTVESWCKIDGKIIDCIIHDHVETGTYTELTRSEIGEYTVAKHHCYLGDTTTGKNVNIASGTETANYDGTSGKNKTIIGNNVKTGIGCLLVPTKKNGGRLIIGDNATIGAGTIITKDVPAGATVVGLNRILEQEEK